MLLTGVVYILFGILSRIFFLPLAGIDFKINYRTRIAIYFLGIIPWYVLHGLYNIVFKDSVIIILAYLIISEAVYALAEASISLPLQRKLKFFRRIQKKTIKNQHLVIIITAIILLYILAARTNSVFMVKT